MLFYFDNCDHTPLQTIGFKFPFFDNHPTLVQNNVDGYVNFNILVGYW